MWVCLTAWQRLWRGRWQRPTKLPRLRTAAVPAIICQAQVSMEANCAKCTLEPGRVNIQQSQSSQSFLELCLGYGLLFVVVAQRERLGRLMDCTCWSTSLLGVTTVRKQPSIPGSVRPFLLSCADSWLPLRLDLGDSSSSTPWKSSSASDTDLPTSVLTRSMTAGACVSTRASASLRHHRTRRPPEHCPNIIKRYSLCKTTLRDSVSSS